MSDLATRLRLVIEHAPKLRAAGVHSLSVDGVSMVLLPPDPPVQADTPADSEPPDMLHDTSTYGLPEGAEVPGFRRPEDLPRKA